MRLLTTTILLPLLLLLQITPTTSETLPFSPPSLLSSNSNPLLDLNLDLEKRQSCASGYLPCAAVGFCCASNTLCTTDYLGQVACCPQGAACTGTIPQSTARSTSTSTGGGGFAQVATSTTTVTQQQQATGTNVIVAAGTTVAFVADTSGARRGRSLPLGVSVVLGVLEYIGGIL